MQSSHRHAEYLETLGSHDSLYGLEWGNPDTTPRLKDIRDNWILPNLTSETVAVEVGSGGGRWSRYFRDTKLTYLVDGTTKSEELISKRFPCERFKFLISKDGSLASIESKSVDYIFSFDTFVHFEEELFYSYLREFSRILKLSGKIHLHFAEKYRELEEHNFIYQDRLKLFDFLTTLGFRYPERIKEFRGGNGSTIIQFTSGTSSRRR